MKFWKKAARKTKTKTKWSGLSALRGESFSLALTLLVGLLLFSYNRLHDLPSDTIFIMFWTSCVSSRLYRLTKRKDTSDLIIMIISLVFLVFYVVKYFSQGW